MLRRLYPVLALAVLTLSGCGYNWFENYDYTGKDPYELYALHELLMARPEGIDYLSDTADIQQLGIGGGGNYVFIGHYAYYSESTVTALLNYVESGNNAFIAAYEMPEDLAYHLFGDACYYENFDYDVYAYYIEDRFPSTYTDSTLAITYPNTDSTLLVHQTRWMPTKTALTVINDDLLCDPELDIEVMGELDTLGVNFVRIGWGEGDFYFTTTPLFLTNWFVRDTASYRYPERVLTAAIGPGPVHLDRYSGRIAIAQQPGAASGANNVPRQYTGGRNLLTGNSALIYIQERRELALAWYTLLAGVLLFVLFRGRRRQRVIPTIPPRENSSKRFIDTISRLVREKGNHRAIAQRELAALRHHLNHRFGLGWREDAPPPEDLARRTGLPDRQAQRAATQIKVVMAGKSMAEGDLLRFYRAIEPLYKV